MLFDGGLAKCLLTSADDLWRVVQLVEEAVSLFSQAHRKSPFPILFFLSSDC